MFWLVFLVFTKREEYVKIIYELNVLGVKIMIFLILLFALCALVCAAVLLKIHADADERTVKFLLALMICSLILSFVFIFTSDFRQKVMTNMFVSSEFSYSQNGDKYVIPLPEGTALGGEKAENGKGYITKATAKQIESFYKNLADEDTFASIKSGGVERISLEYKGKKFLVKHSKYKNKYRYLSVEAAKNE